VLRIISTTLRTTTNMNPHEAVTRYSRVGQINSANLRTKTVTRMNSDSVDSKQNNEINQNNNASNTRVRRRTKHMNSNHSSVDSRKATDAALVGRLQELLVLEISKDGSRMYLQLSVRGLYKHVISCITNTRNFPIPSNNTNTNCATTATDNLARLPSVRFEIPEDESENPFTSNAFSPVETSSIFNLSAKNLHSNYSSNGNSKNILTENTTSESSPDDTCTETSQTPFIPSLPPPPAPAMSSFRKAKTPQQQYQVNTSTYFSTNSPHISRPVITDTFGNVGLLKTPIAPSLPKPARRGGRCISIGVLGENNSNNASGLPPSGDPVMSPPKRTNSASTASDIHPPLPSQQQQQVTYRERLGAYIHPRDMRRLVTPFSASNEPELIVRRHVMLLNFDPLRAIILRDRLLVLVPDGADSILANLEQRIRGGADEVINSIFGHHVEENGQDAEEESYDDPGEFLDTATANISESIPNEISQDKDIIQQPKANNEESTSNGTIRTDNAPSSEVPFDTDVMNACDSDADETREISVTRVNPIRKFGLPRSMSMNALNKLNKSNLLLPLTQFTSDTNNNSDIPRVVDAPDENNDNNDDDESSGDDDDEWDEMEGREWIDLPFELLCVDAVLYVIGTMLSVETDEIRKNAADCIHNLLTNESGGGNHDHPLTSIRAVKDAVREMTSRVKGFVQSMNRILDEDEDMALMNLSRLLTHPQRFIQPVPQEVLEEESDEPELILEANLQIVLTILNSLDLIQGQIDTASELVDQKLDALRNRLLFANMLISVFTLAVTFAALIGSIFGMNLTNPLEEDTGTGPFRRVVIGTSLSSIALVVFILWVLTYSGTVPRTSYRGM
jgi:hypothetical protein